MADEMPARRTAADGGNLDFCFLHAVLSQVSHAGCNRLAHDFGRVHLAYRHQSDLISGALTAARGHFDPVANCFDSFD